MRISDWSSDVCSSDLGAEVGDVVDQDQSGFATGTGREPGQRWLRVARGWQGAAEPGHQGSDRIGIAAVGARLPALHGGRPALRGDRLEERKRGGSGTSVWVRVATDGVRDIKQKTKY